MLVCQLPRCVTSTCDVHLGRIIVKRSYTIPFTLVYPIDDPRLWNTNNFVSPEVVIWYVNFLRQTFAYDPFGSLKRPLERSDWGEKLRKKSYIIPCIWCTWNITIEYEIPTILWSPKSYIGLSTFWGHNFCIESLFWLLKGPFERHQRWVL